MWFAFDDMLYNIFFSYKRNNYFYLGNLIFYEPSRHCNTKFYLSKPVSMYKNWECYRRPYTKLTVVYLKTAAEFYMCLFDLTGSKLYVNVRRHFLQGTK